MSVYERFFPIAAGGSEYATGDPTKLLTQVAWQTDDEIPSASTRYDVITQGGALAPVPLWVDPLGIRGSGQQQAQLEGKFDVPGGPQGLKDLDPKNRAQLMTAGNILQRVTTSSLGSGAYRHVFGLSQTTLVPSWMNWHRDDGLGRPIRYEQVRCNALNVSAAPRANAKMVASLLAGKFDLHGTVTESTGSGETVPLFRGVWDGNLSLDSVDDDIYGVTSTTTSAGVTGMRFKRGASGTLGTEILITHGSTGAGQAVGRANWYYVLVGASDALCGDGAEAVMIHIPDGATYSSVAPDTFKLPRRRDRWSASYANQVPITETRTRFLINGTERFAMQGGWEFSLAVPCTRIEDTGGTQAITTDRFGELVATLTGKRRLLDLTFQNTLMRRDPLGVVITAMSDTLISSSSQAYGWAAVFPYLTIGGTPAYSVADGGTNRDENITWTAREVPVGGTGLTAYGVTFTDAVSLIAWNDLSTVV